MNENFKTLVVVTGATASGKTALAIDIAERLGCDVISADSRQIYKGMPIGTAAPSAEEMARVRHHLVGFLEPQEYYSAATFESDALALLARQWENSDYAVVCGGSMMYVDALTDGIDPLPTISDEVRAKVKSLLAQHGPKGILALLEISDPEYFAVVDRSNIKRVAHALEITLQAGVPYSKLRTGMRVSRPFKIVKLAIDMPRDELFGRINRRVERMVKEGLVDEARQLLPLRHLNALNTVGYKEVFRYLDGEWSLSEATARMAKNTRVYAKKQLTWLARPTVRPAKFVSPNTPISQIISMISSAGI